MKRAEEQDMSAALRREDSPEVKPTRVVSLGVVVSIATGVAVAFAGAFGAFWVTTVEQAGITRTEIRHINDGVQDLKDEMKTLNAQMAAKSSKDAEQDAKLIDVDRRITRLESR